MIPGRRFCPAALGRKQSYWTCPVNSRNKQLLQQLGFKIIPLKSKASNRSLKTPKIPQDYKKEILRDVDNRLRDYQIDGIKWAQHHNFRTLNADDMGCISGDGIVAINRGGCSHKMTMRDLYHKFHGGASGNKSNVWRADIDCKIRAYKSDVNQFRLHTIKNVLHRGNRACIKVTTQRGKIITLTPDHEVMCLDYTWKAIGEIGVGGALFTNGTPICKSCGSSENVIHSPRKDVIVSVEDAGVIDVYDIVMSDPYRNFVVDGVLVHNCGKTAQVVSCIRTSRIRPVLFIVPATLKINIFRECQMWLNPEDRDRMYIVEGKSKASMNYADKDIVIINYDILSAHVLYIIKHFKPRFVIIDEAHALKAGSHYIAKYYPERPMKSSEIIKTVKGVKGVYNALPKRLLATQRIVLGLCDEEQKATQTKWDGVEHVIPMTGTPILNHPGDIFNLLQLIHPERFTDRYVFEDFFCEMEPGYSPGTMKITGAKNADLLHCELVEKYMIRRKITDVCKELPPTISTVVPFKMTGNSKRAYEEAEEDMEIWLEERENIRSNVMYQLKKLHDVSRLDEPLSVYLRKSNFTETIQDPYLKSDYEELKDTILPWVQHKYPVHYPVDNQDLTILKWFGKIRKLRKTFTAGDEDAIRRFSTLMDLAYEAKQRKCIKFVDELLEDPKRKVVLFGVHKKVVNGLQDHYGKKAVKLNGEMSMDEKQKSVDAFQNDPTIRVFVGNVIAAGTGLTLTAANTVVFFETGYSAAIVQQCIARAARMGQKASNVLVYFLTADNTVEEKVMLKLASKQNIMDAIIDGKVIEISQALGELWKQHRISKS
jgi:hypothetical protein